MCVKLAVVTLFAAIALACGSNNWCKLCYGDEKPLRTVYLGAFCIEKTEVTNSQYARCVAAGACRPPGRSDSYARCSYCGNPGHFDYPVISVSWNEVKAYLQWAGRCLRAKAE